MGTISVRGATAAVWARHPENPASCASRRVTTTRSRRDQWVGGMSRFLKAIGRGLRSPWSHGSVEPSSARDTGVESLRAHRLYYLQPTDRRDRVHPRRALRQPDYQTVGPCAKHMEQEGGRRSRAEGDSRRVANKVRRHESRSGRHGARDDPGAALVPSDRRAQPRGRPDRGIAGRLGYSTRHIPLHRLSPAPIRPDVAPRSNRRRKRLGEFPHMVIVKRRVAQGSIGAPPIACTHGRPSNGCLCKPYNQLFI
jgi:hypothetical protein